MGLEINAERTKYCIWSCLKASMQERKNHNIKMGNNSFARMEQFRYLETTLTDQKSIHEEIKSP
jgi:hypothetical protein